MKKLADFFIFSSLYIAFCAIVMIVQTSMLFLNGETATALYVFVFCSTICSYNFHWYLTTQSTHPSERLDWSHRHRPLQIALFIMGLIGAGISFLYIREHWLWIAISVVLTFLYSAPKIEGRPFRFLRKIAVGKTIFLAMVWMYVTTLLPMLLAEQPMTIDKWLFAISRFFLIYAICIVFDYRDREDDRAAGIRSMITFFNEKGINILFGLSLLIFLVSTVALHTFGVSILNVALLILPGLVLAALYRHSKTNYSDYLFYFVLDGLMMLSSILMLVEWI